MSTHHSIPKTQHIDAGGVSLAYFDWPGDRGPLLCLPSITGHKGSFSAVARKLAPEYRVIALDLRGRGDSDKPDGWYGFAYHARDVFAFADALGFETFSVVGHSFGATAGVYLASIRPGRVRSLVLLDGGADPKVETLQLMRQGIRRLEKTYPSLDQYLEAQRSVPYYRPWTNALETYLSEDVFVQPNGSVRSKSSAKALEIDLDMHFQYSMCLHFPNVKCPVLFLRPQQGLLGSSDHVYSDAEATNIVRSIPNGKRVNVQGGNHYTMLIQDDPPVVPFIDEFLRQVLRKTVTERTV